MIDALRGYLQIASGLTEATTKRAVDVARSLQPGGVDLDPSAVTERVQGIADDLLATSRANRELLIGLIRSEIDRAVGRMGFVREEELTAVRRHVQRVEQQVASIRDAATAAASAATSVATSAASAVVPLSSGGDRPGSSARPSTPSVAAAPSSTAPSGTTPARKAARTSARPSAATTSASSSASSSGRTARARKARAGGPTAAQGAAGEPGLPAAATEAGPVGRKRPARKTAARASSARAAAPASTTRPPASGADASTGSDGDASPVEPSA